MLVLHVGVYSKTNLNYEGFIILIGFYKAGEWAQAVYVFL